LTRAVLPGCFSGRHFRFELIHPAFNILIYYLLAPVLPLHTHTHTHTQLKIPYTGKIISNDARICVCVVNKFPGIASSNLSDAGHVAI
jgi:hypothetical protein